MTASVVVPLTEGRSRVAGRDASVWHLLKPVAPWLDDDDVTEIAVNRPGEVWVEARSRWSCHAVPGADLAMLMSLATATATYSSQAISSSTPLLSAALPDGSRIQFVVPPAVEEGRVSFTLRKPARSTMTLADFESSGLFDEVQPIKAGLSTVDEALVQLLKQGQYASFCRAAVKARKNIVVCGATGSGKTTFMKGLTAEIPLTERLITIEDVRELFLPHKNAVHLLYSKGGQSQANTSAKSLLESCLRMKPDRILLAELRGDECLYFVRNAASGHPGSITSCHAGSTAMAFEQMAIMIQDSPGGANLTFDTIKRLLQLTIDVIVQFQCVDGRRSISEIYFDPEVKANLR